MNRIVDFLSSLDRGRLAALVGALMTIATLLIHGCLLDNRSNSPGPGPSITPVVSADITIPVIPGGG